MDLVASLYVTMSLHVLMVHQAVYLDLGSIEFGTVYTGY